MCGIAAIIGKESANHEAYLRESLGHIRHRGSSSDEIALFPSAALGTNRLPITDRQGGQQPCFNEDGTIAVVLNGEIFNYRVLMDELKKSGHVFKTECDTEVLVHLYEQYGPKMTDHIDSEMFAFVVYDSVKNEYFATRDKVGVKPLYWAKNKKETVFFGSELKQLVGAPGIVAVHEVLPGSYLRNGTSHSYGTFSIGEKHQDENAVKKELTRLIVDAVRKRVDTDLPVAVLLSGGVDSSLIMEIACRMHPDVTAFILGKLGAPDYEAAVKLCAAHRYKHVIVEPDVDYAAEVDAIIASVETYEAQVIRQCFSLDVLSKAVVRSGFRIALVGDGSDEIFGGYNEFASLDTGSVNAACRKMLTDLARGHNMRLDRMTMRHTLEARAPFLDDALIDYALNIEGSLKVHQQDHAVETKYILRKVAEDFLPMDIAHRYKVPFSNGAGMNVGYNFAAGDGDVAKAVAGRTETCKATVAAKLNLRTQEERYYYAKFCSFGYNRLADHERRITTKDSLVRDHATVPPRLLVAEFAKLPIYFPLYLAAQRGLFLKRGIDVRFIETGGDDATYASLLNNSAQIGISDPVFSYSDNPSKVQGRIIGELVGNVPMLAVSTRPLPKADTAQDLNQYGIATFQRFSTTHTIAKTLLPKADIRPYHHAKILPALVNHEVDIAIVIPEMAHEIIQRGGHLVYDFSKDIPHFLFSGFTISDCLGPQYHTHLEPFLDAVREAIRFIGHHPEEAAKDFQKEFPHFLAPESFIETNMHLWSPSLRIHEDGLRKAKHIWHGLYPWLLKSNEPRFREPDPSDAIVRILSDKRFSRDIPYRTDELRGNIARAMKKNMPIPLVFFWGASDKEKIDENDTEAFGQLKKLQDELSKAYAPGIDMTVLLADEHAIANGYDSRVVRSYLTSVERQLKKQGMRCMWLHTLWKMWRISRRSLEKQRVRREMENRRWWSDVDVRDQLEESASKHAITEDARRGAQRYYLMRREEAGHLAKTFRHSAFATYSSDDQQGLFPDMPTLYLWVRKGKSHVPWFSQGKQDRG